MSRAGDAVENPVTGERAVVELFARAGGAVAVEHVHPAIDEWVMALEGRVGFRLDGRHRKNYGPDPNVFYPARTPRCSSRNAAILG